MRKPHNRDGLYLASKRPMIEHYIGGYKATFGMCVPMSECLAQSGRHGGCACDYAMGYVPPRYPVPALASASMVLMLRRFIPGETNFAWDGIRYRRTFYW